MEFFNNLEKSHIVIGAASSGLILIAYAIIYNLVLIELVRKGNEFLGSPALFIGAMVLPLIISALLRNLSLAIGNIIGILFYFFIALPISMLLIGG